MRGLLSCSLARQWRRPVASLKVRPLARLRIEGIVGGRILLLTLLRHHVLLVVIYDLLYFFVNLVAGRVRVGLKLRLGLLRLAG